MTPFIDKSYRSVAAATITELSCAAVVPVMPAMASDDVGALQVLWALGRNAYSAFPSRCLVEPVVKLRIAGRHLALTCAPDAIGHMFPARAQMMRQFFEQPGVAEITAQRNGSLQGAYLIIVPRTPFRPKSYSLLCHFLRTKM
jgi:hypothetical protein